MATAAHYQKHYSARGSFGFGVLVRLFGKSSQLKSGVSPYMAHLALASSKPEFQSALKSSKPGKPLSER